MNSKRIQLLLTGVATWISLLLMITTTYGGSIVIGGDYTDVGTIVVISPKPGDSTTANGTALLNNLSATPSDLNQPYLIKLGPGIYDIGTSSLQMKEYVDIEGSGENTTIIRGHIDSVISGVVQGANHAEIRFLKVENTGTGNAVNAVYNDGLDILLLHMPSTFKMTNMTVYVSGGSDSNYGVDNESSSPTMTNVTVYASGRGNSAVRGIFNDASSPTMTNVTVSASGGAVNIGVASIGVPNDSSSPTMMNLRVSASGGSANTYGILNYYSSPTIMNVRVSASGGSGGNYGILNLASSPTMMNVTASASGGTDNYGVGSAYSGTVMINNSVIIGSTNTIYNGTGPITRVGNTELDGGAVYNDSTLTCVGVYNGNYVALNASCQ